jgi:uncharacterized damage-inducible protein DinB
MSSKIHTSSLLAELQRETTATHKCLKNITADSFGFKPHETSMEMRYLALLVAEIPLWIVYMLEKGELDFATYPVFKFDTNAQLVSHFEDCVKKAEAALEKATDDDLEKTFTLKRDGKALYSSPLKVDIPTTLNHWVHHRGQLTVYMRMNGIKVPSIYGPSGDDKDFNA